jgi:hypothetical protein
MRHHYYTDPDGNTFQLDLPDPEPIPLEPVGALATLLAVKELVTVEEAASAVALTPEALINEALAWSLGGA